MASQSIVLVGIAGYFAILLFIGYAAGRRIKTSIDFVIAGRRLPLWLCTATLFATWFGGGTCIGAAGAAFSNGFLGVIADPFGATLCLVLAGFFYVRILRRMRLVTLADFFRIRFGPAAEFLAAFLTVPPFLAWAGSQFVALGFVFRALTGIGIEWAIVLGAAVVLIYTLQGGMWAVSITDFWQAIVLIAGFAFLLPIAIHDVGGWSSLRGQLPESHLAFLPEPSFRQWTWYIEAWLIVGLGSIPSQDLLQRALGARDERVAQNSAYLAAVLYVVVGVIPVLLGMIGRVIMPEIADPELILPELGLKYLPPAGMALFGGALLSAIMSSADSALLAGSTVFTENILVYLKRGRTPEQQLRQSRWVLFGFALIALAFALWFQNVYELMLDSMAVGLVALFVPFTCGLYWKKANSWGAVASIVGGTVAWGVALLLQSSYPADLIGAAASAVTMAAVTLMTAHRVPALELRNREGEPVAYANRLGVLALVESFGRKL